MTADGKFAARQAEAIRALREAASVADEPLRSVGLAVATAWHAAEVAHPTWTESWRWSPVIVAVEAAFGLDHGRKLGDRYHGAVSR